MLATLAVTLAVTPLGAFDQCLIAMRRIKRLSALNAARLLVLYALVPLGHALFGERGAIAGVAAAALLNAVVVLAVQRHLGLLDARRDLAALPMFGAGLLLGIVVRFATS
jgi:hypothetical protein